MPTRNAYGSGDDVAEGHSSIVAPLTPSTGQIVAHRGWSTARDALIAAVQAGPGIVALLGPAGTGKTLLLHDVARALQAELPNVLLVDRGDAVPDAEALQGAVLIDEADRMDADALANLARRPDLAVVLAALPAFADRLAALPGAAIVTLGPIDEAEVPRFVAERLVQLGYAPDLLTLSAITALFERSGSVPRLLHTLLGLAVFAASLEGAERVGPEDVARAVLFRDGEEVAAEPPAIDPDVPELAPEPVALVAIAPLAAATPALRRRRWLVGAFAVLLICIGAATALLRHSPAGPPAPVAPDPDAAPASVATAEPAPQPPAPAAPTPEASPPLASAVAGPTLPSGSMIRVVLSYPMGDPGAARRGADVARQLRAEGVTVGEPVPVTPRVNVPSLLYYFTQDRDGAAEIGRKLDGRFGEATFARLPRHSALPRPGTIEFLLPPSEP